MTGTRATDVRYAIFDVFTNTPLAGNPLAVVMNADMLDETQMQALAQEFNLSETVFVLRPDKDLHAARLRIFTPMTELPFAGHPTVGAAVAIALERRAASAPAQENCVFMLEEGVGDIRSLVKLGDPAAGRQGGFAEFDLPRSSRPVRCLPKRAAIAEALGLSEHQIGFENHAISVWNAGLPYVCVPLKDRQAMAECRCDARLWENLAPVDQGLLADAFVYTRGGLDHTADFHARMFAPRMGIAEDPATGSAVAALSGAIRQFDDLPDGYHALAIEQGVEMGRPSRIDLHIEIENGEIARTRIGGHAVRVAEGTLHL